MIYCLVLSPPEEINERQLETNSSPIQENMGKRFPTTSHYITQVHLSSAIFHENVSVSGKILSRSGEYSRVLRRPCAYFWSVLLEMPRTNAMNSNSESTVGKLSTKVRAQLVFAILLQTKPILPAKNHQKSGVFQALNFGSPELPNFDRGGH